MTTHPPIGARIAPGSTPAVRLARAAILIVSLVFVVGVAVIAASDGFVYDAHAYWLSDGYSRPSQAQDAFSYSPPILLLFQVIRAVLPWELFAYAYSIGIAVGIWVLAGPFTPFVVFTPHVASELTLGNIHVFLALVAVFGLRWPWLWAFALLTKVTPGVGVLWFAVRGEWRNLAIALGATAALALPTVLVFPDLWAGWVGVLTAAGPGASSDLPVRLAAAVVLVVIGARRDWPWLVPVASMLALPILWSLHGFSMLLGTLWFVRKLEFGPGHAPRMIARPLASRGRRSAS